MSEDGRHPYTSEKNIRLFRELMRRHTRWEMAADERVEKHLATAREYISQMVAVTIFATQLRGGDEPFDDGYRQALSDLMDVIEGAFGPVPGPEEP